MVNIAAVKGGFTIRPVLLCGEITPRQKEALEALGFAAAVLPACPALPPPLSRHPDLLLYPLGDGFLLDKEYGEKNAAFFDSLRLPRFYSRQRLGPVYPRDVLFNALPLGKTVYGSKFAAEEVKSGAFRFVPIRQGYARCSAALIGGGIVTADPSLAKALERDGREVLRIRPGFVALPGYSYGFLGGASLTISPELTVFFGQLEDHPDYPAMAAFAKRRGTSLLSLSNEPLTDRGGGFPALPLPSSRPPEKEDFPA